MRPAARLLQQACRITLFTRENCGLCAQARSVLSDVWDARPFDFKEVDIIKAGSGPELGSKPRWRDLYEFDVPVVGVLFLFILLLLPSTLLIFPLFISLPSF